ncbi:DUF167 family protein YggU [Pseudomonadota bacterium]|uniref:DUF167 family protein YggU n=1 Tax=unclassified Shewanella TaxID=196818 RepID=UPI000C83B950|nr:MULTISPECIES: DUF167 family protein YggU [unclassified Shewanella]MDO6617582.1 DUF167 family protein YggU [Shewanella sp. 6_MG-2023]MDO6639212.1 DUF167 family protein YggU [Shewanella sp. 5_MG-2023]MDO6776627.1 DUF167 family protein YggU [Shewanella sp. 3_MG-2023]PMG31485.1 YggU family protein [Shewanella sp. 10N.286.52.C2]PMH84366.1 YggU family protein [Shewanella sp. 10N.286.48.B5]
MPVVIQQQSNLLLNLYIQPKASRDKIVGLHGDEIKIAITAPPIDGKANSHLIKYLAKAFKVPKSDVMLLKGLQGRHKQVKILSPLKIPPEISQIIAQCN